MENKEHLLENYLKDLLESGIVHIMLINERGRVDFMASKSEIQLSKERQEIFSMGLRLQQSLLQEFDDEFGPIEHFVVCRKKTKIVSIPLGSRNLIFIMDNACDHTSVIKKTKAIKNGSFKIMEREPLCVEVLHNG